MSISDVDLKIIRCLQRNARATNKSIASATGVTEQTVAGRIRSMSDGHVMRVMAQRDLQAAGYRLLAFASIFVLGGSLKRVASQLTAIEEAFSVVLCPGSPELIVTFVAPDAATLDGMMQRVHAIFGVVSVELTTAEEITTFRLGSGNLRTDVGPPLPLDRQDSLDEAIIALLVENGRQSNREIARRINISEGSVRIRLKRLAERRAMRLGVVCEPDRIGYAAGAYVYLDGSADVLAMIVDEMAEEEIVSFAAVTDGAHGALLFCVAASEALIAALCVDRLRAISGVDQLIYRPLLRSLKHRYDYVFVGDDKHQRNWHYVPEVATKRKRLS
ncbi:Lrp/AsnC family transcriptional regulator [Sphingomonas sp. NBWT7]|uniref:Lrp/AsnC family transcriptional regulator n=1 Tax=Sphingomonas sp. NBWT7 TaxID=2596913 RepID=UPI001625775C|nr:Lrp/AsnC family transcriptional regulator [Sphingomonas sp. NBWT7]QNE32503.1 Lrp/AsnC family transcriptional regulator [Sphingomonas sp. NBWT7]